MTALIHRIRFHAETVAEFLRLGWRHRFRPARMMDELDAERERLYAEIIGAAQPSRLGPLDVSYRFGVDDRTAVWRAIIASGVDFTKPAPNRPIRYYSPAADDTAGDVDA